MVLQTKGALLVSSLCALLLSIELLLIGEIKKEKGATCLKFERESSCSLRRPELSAH
jgi:hypothetical protein